jgi:predicted amino acid dehydrogenase
LADDGLDLLLIGRTAERARALLGSVVRGAVFSGDIAAVRDAGIVVLLASDPTAELLPEFVSEGTIVIDVCQPPNVPVEAHGAFRMRGIEVVQGGIVQIPGYACTCCLAMPTPGTTFACLAETYLFAREGIREHSIGRPNAELALQLERVAQKYGVTPRALNISYASPSPRARSDAGTPTLRALAS